MALEWRYTYLSARRDGYSRRAAMHKFLREIVAAWRLSLGLHPRYDKHGRARRG